MFSPSDLKVTFSTILLNVSPYLPSQVFMALTGLCMFVAIRVWTYRRAKYMWDGPYRAAALAALWVFLTVSVFIFSGLYGPLKPWQTTVHMLEEVASMSTFTYLAFDVTRAVPIAVNSRPLRLLLKSSAATFPVCWLSAFVIGYAHPFPMTGLLHALPPEAFTYRALLIAPCVFYAGLMSAVVLRSYLLAQTERADRPYRRRLRLFVLGHLALFALYVDFLIWAYLQSFASSNALRLLAPWYVVAEIAIFLSIGAFWTLGIVSTNRTSDTDQALKRHKRFLRGIRKVKTELLVELPRRAPDRRRTLAYIRQASEDPILHLSSCDTARAERVFELIAANSTGATTYGPDCLLGLYGLYDALVNDLPRNSPEWGTLTSDPLPVALRPAAHVLREYRAGQDTGATHEPRWAQLGYAAAADLGLLHKDVLSSLDPQVVIALRRAKSRDDEAIDLQTFQQKAE